MTVLNELQAIVREERIKRDFVQAKRELEEKWVREIFDQIILRLGRVARKGEDFIVFTNPKAIPDEVDYLLRSEGLIVWRNSEILKVVIPGV